MSGTREATHAGSWYTSSGSQLSKELSSNLSRVTPLSELDYDPPVQDAKAIIAPHAGYSYSGPAAAWAYAAIPTEHIKRIFLLGPSHHVHLNGIALSGFEKYETPIGDIPLCLDTIKKLRQTGLFSEMKGSTDEDEHSLEMHLPYIRHVFSGRDNLKLVPLLVGHPDPTKHEQLNKLLAEYWADKETFFIISSDFCHWGTRFSHTPYYPKAPHPLNPVPPVPVLTQPASLEPPELMKRFSPTPDGVPIWQSIQYMDHEGMDLLRYPGENGALAKWEAYLSRTKNTICGRNPISVLVGLMEYLYEEGGREDGNEPHLQFVRYEQSSKCVKGGDSSVSYVSGVLRVPR